METLTLIEETIKQTLTNYSVSNYGINNIIELVRLYGTINYSNGEIKQLKQNINEIKSNNTR